MKKAIETLSKFGFVKTCKIIDDSIVTIVVTRDKAPINTLHFLKACTESFPNHPLAETAVIDENLAILVLKAKK